MWTQTFLVEGRYLGTAMRKHDSKHADPPRGCLFVCPSCGRTWATCPIEGRPFQVWVRPCLQHPLWKDFGSVWLSWDPDFTDAFPPDLLSRELNYLLEHAV